MVYEKNPKRIIYYPNMENRKNNAKSTVFLFLYD